MVELKLDAVVLGLGVELGLELDDPKVTLEVNEPEVTLELDDPESVAVV